MALFTGMYVVELHVANSLQTDAEDYFKVNRPEAWLIIERPRVLWVLSGKVDVNTISTWRANPKCDCVIPFEGGSVLSDLCEIKQLDLSHY